MFFFFKIIVKSVTYSIAIIEKKDIYDIKTKKSKQYTKKSKNKTNGRNSL